MTIGVGGYRDLPPGNVNKGGSVRAPGEPEPETKSAEKKEISPELKEKILEVLEKARKEMELFYGTIVYPQEILKNDMYKNKLFEIVNRISKNFPWDKIDLGEMLKILQIKNKWG